MATPYTGRQDYPAYNPSYPQQTGYPPQQPGYPPQQPGYQPGPAPGVPQYPQYPQQPYGQQYPQYPPQQQSAPVVVNMSSNQNQAAPLIGTSTVFLGRSYESEYMPALIIFIVGWFCCPVWGAGFKFIRSRNQTARVLGIASIVMFFLGIASIVITVSVIASAASAINNSRLTTNQLVLGSNQAMYYVSSSYSTTKIAYNYGTWGDSLQGGYVTGNGYSSVYCTSAGCPVYGSNLMAVVAKCGYTGTWQLVGSSSTYLYCPGNTIYIQANDNTLNNNYGSVTVTLTMS